MTTNTVKQLGQSALTATLTTTLYTVPASTKCILKEVVLCNTDTTSRAVTLRAGASPATGVLSTLLAAIVLAPGETRIFTFSTVLEAAHLITGGASAAAVVSCTLSGVEVV